MFHSPHAVPAHSSRGDLQIAMLRCQLQLQCSGCRYLQGDPACHGFCGLHGAVLSPYAQFWRSCTGKHLRDQL